MAEKVAVVTGANKGIGFSVVKGLCQKFNGIVYLTSRNEDRGLETIEKLAKIGLKPKYYQLDVSNDDSVKKFGEHLKNEHGGLDVLVNNAAVLEWNAIYPTYEVAKSTIETNYRGLIRMEKYVYPLLRNGARVINVCSAAGHLSNLKNDKWIQILKSGDLTVEKLNEFVDDYLESVKNGTFKKEDFADDGKHAEFRVSKIAEAALSMIQAKKYSSKNISVNLIHPGHVKTDMANGGGKIDPDDAAKGILYLIFEASSNMTGTFMWHDRKLIDWYNEEGENYLTGLW